MLDPRNAKSSSDCLAMAAAVAGEYPLCLGWQTCLEPLLPDLRAERESRCLAFFIDDDIGPHFVVEADGRLTEIRLADAGFVEPFDAHARLWLDAFSAWWSGQLSLLGSRGVAALRHHRRGVETAAH